VTERRSSAFRPDIEGLRAIAIGLVLLYHAGLPFLRGGFVGVDIFFVISGFLITSLLVREAERTGRISLTQFYARRAKRLLPAAALVLVVTAILTVVLIPGSDQRNFGGDIAAAAAYVVNWRLALRSVDYLAEGAGASPVLHFWSLSVEEQFYLVWPLLMIVAIVLARRFGKHARGSMLVALSVVGVPSFIFSVTYTASSPASAFFVTPTRLWELSVGAAVAIAVPALTRLRRSVAVWIGIAGILAIAYSAVFLSEASAWPGYLAAIPVLGTAAVIAGGAGHGDTIVARGLGLRPMVWVGGISYSLYLWHWPALIFAEALLGPLRVREAMVVVLLSVIPAYLSLVLVENPVRFSKRLARGNALGLAVGAWLTFVGIAAGLAVMVASPQKESGSADPIIIEVPAPSPGAPTPDPSTLFGAQALGTDPEGAAAGTPQSTYDSITPTPANAPEDIPRAYDEGCQASQDSSTPVVCSVGAKDGTFRIAALGDSKMLQYYEAFDALGKSRGWTIDFVTKSACSSTEAMPRAGGGDYTSCAEFNEKVFEWLEADPPDAVMTTQTPAHVAAGVGEPQYGSWVADGLVARWDRIQSIGVPVIVLLDYPFPTLDEDVYRCMERNTDALNCTFDRAEGDAKSAAPNQRLALAGDPDAKPIDISRYVCPQERCAPVIGGALVLRQGSHLTNSYALSLTGVLAREFDPLVAELSAP